MASLDRLDLDRGAHMRDVEQVITADVGDAKSALSDADDQTARHQPRQSLAQRRGADVIALHEIDDAEPRARRQDDRRGYPVRPAWPRARSGWRPPLPAGWVGARKPASQSLI